MSRRHFMKLAKRIQMLIRTPATQARFDLPHVGDRSRSPTVYRAPDCGRRRLHVRLGMIGGVPNLLKTRRSLTRINSMRLLSRKKVLRQLLRNGVMS
jgi:hypothetical protein